MSLDPREQGRIDEHHHCVDPARYQRDPQYRTGVQQQRSTEGGSFSGSTSHHWGCPLDALAALVVTFAAVYLLAQLARAVL